MDDASRRDYHREYSRARRATIRAQAPTRTCGRCGAEFPVRQGNVRYCSDECGRSARLERRRQHEYQPRPLDCAECDGSVPYKSGRRRYCSDACAIRAGTKRRRWQIKGLDPTTGSLPEQCGICGRSDRKLVIDHDHRCCPSEVACGRCVRGLLCHGCNVALGIFRDDPRLLRLAARYIEQKCQLRLVI